MFLDPDDNRECENACQKLIKIPLQIAENPEISKNELHKYSNQTFFAFNQEKDHFVRVLFHPKNESKIFSAKF